MVYLFLAFDYWKLVSILDNAPLELGGPVVIRYCEYWSYYSSLSIITYLLVFDDFIGMSSNRY